MTDGGSARQALEALEAERRDVREAVAAIRTAMHRINEALERLGTADELGRADFWGDGLVSSWIKRDSVDRAAGVMRAVDLELAEVRTRLRAVDVEGTAGLVAGAAPHVTGLDVWFDNLVSDALSRRRVRKASVRLDALARVLTRVQSTLNRRDRDLTERIEARQA